MSFLSVDVGRFKRFQEHMDWFRARYQNLKKKDYPDEFVAVWPNIGIIPSVTYFYIVHTEWEMPFHCLYAVCDDDARSQRLGNDNTRCRRLNLVDHRSCFGRGTGITQRLAP